MRSASRQVSAAGPPRPRATSSACLTSKSRSERSFDAEPSTPSPTGRPCVEERANRRHACSEPKVGRRAVRDADPVAAELCDVRVGEMDAMRAPDVRGRPAELLEVLDRRAAEQLAAVGVLLDRLRQMRVQPKPVAPGELGRLGHQLLRDGERRARRDCDLHHRACPRVVHRRREPLRVSEHVVEFLDDRVRRQATTRLAEVHRPS